MSKVWGQQGEWASRFAESSKQCAGCHNKLSQPNVAAEVDQQARLREKGVGEKPDLVGSLVSDNVPSDSSMKQQADTKKLRCVVTHTYFYKQHTTASRPTIRTNPLLTKLQSLSAPSHTSNFLP